MRDFRDAKTMAQSLRKALQARSVETTHSESLELIARAFGCDNWNILSARIDAAQPTSARVSPPDAASPQLLLCSFCGKSQHQVRKLVAGPGTYICDECIGLCGDIVDDALMRLMQGDAESARALSTERLTYYVERARKGAERDRVALQEVERELALRANGAVDDAPTVPDLAYLQQRSADELRAMQRFLQSQLEGYAQVLRTAPPVLQERGP
jgi:hypothetical protein